MDFQFFFISLHQMDKKIKKHSIDIRDICYFIDHVKNIDFRASLIKELGYKIGVNVLTKDSHEKMITIGKKGEIRLQISPNENKMPLVKCAIIE